MRRRTLVRLVGLLLPIVGGFAAFVLGHGLRWIEIAGGCFFFGGWVALFVAVAPAPRWAWFLVVATFVAGTAWTIHGAFNERVQAYWGLAFVAASCLLGCLAWSMGRQDVPRPVSDPREAGDDSVPVIPPPDLSTRELAYTSRRFGYAALITLVVPFLICQALGDLLMETAQAYWLFPFLVPVFSISAVISAGFALHGLSKTESSEQRGWAGLGLSLGLFTLFASAALIAWRFAFPFGSDS